MHKFGKSSSRKLATCHEDLQKIAILALSRSKVDFGITEGHRSLERQNMLFMQGKSKIDGKHMKGKHNYMPSLAIDIYAYHTDLQTRRMIAYDIPTICYIAGIIDACAVELYNKGEISHIIRWGLNWDSDGVIAFDQSFDDAVHFELKKPNV